MRVALLGRTQMLLRSGELLAAQGHEIVAVATCRAAPEYAATEADFAALAAAHDAPFWNAATLNTADAIAWLRSAQADVAVSVNWMTRIGAEAIACFPHGILNAHAGALPRYRGNAPVAWAILNGETEIGVCVHQMDPEEIDAGPILGRFTIPLTDQTYIGQVFAELETRVPHLFAKVLRAVADGIASPCAQQGPVLRCYPRRPEDGAIEWAQPADRIARLVRASAEPFAGAFAMLNGERLTIWRARVKKAEHADTLDPTPTFYAVRGSLLARDIESGTVSVACGGWDVLLLETVQHGDGPRQPAALVLRSLRDRLHDG